MLIRSVVIMLIILIFIVVISWNDKSDVNVTPYVVASVCLIMGYSIFRTLSKQKTMFESYKLTIDKDTLIRERFSTPTISIPCNDVIEILKNKNGAFVVKAKHSSKNIYIPAQIDKRAELENTLKQIKEITVKTSNPAFAQYLNYAAMFMVLVGMACIYTVDNKIVVGVSGLIVSSMMIWGLYVIRTNKNIDAKTKRSSWLFLIVLISIIAIVYRKLTI